MKIVLFSFKNKFAWLSTSTFHNSKLNKKHSIQTNFIIYPPTMPHWREVVPTKTEKGKFITFVSSCLPAFLWFLCNFCYFHHRTVYNLRVILAEKRHRQCQCGQRRWKRCFSARFSTTQLLRFALATFMHCFSFVFITTTSPSASTQKLSQDMQNCVKWWKLFAFVAWWKQLYSRRCNYCLLDTSRGVWRAGNRMYLVHSAG